jgi:hypothetical protein
MRRRHNNNPIWNGFLWYGTARGIGSILDLFLLFFVTLPLRVLRWGIRTNKKSAVTRARIRRHTK